MGRLMGIRHGGPVVTLFLEQADVSAPSICPEPLAYGVYSMFLTFHAIGFVSMANSVFNIRGLLSTNQSDTSNSSDFQVFESFQSTLGLYFFLQIFDMELIDLRIKK